MKLMAMRPLGIDSGNIIFMKDASREEMDAMFGTHKDHSGILSRIIDPKGQSEVYIFYAGHGARDGSDYTLLSVDRAFYPLSELCASLSNAKPKSITVFLDAPNSGLSTAFSSRVSSTHTKISVFAATARDQLASEDKDVGLGIFTRYVARRTDGGGGCEQEQGGDDEGT
jgi:Caspase domain